MRSPYPASNSPTGLARGQTSGDLLSLNNAQLSRRTPAGSRPHTPGLLQVLPNSVAVPAHASGNHGCRLAATPPFPDFGLLSCCVVGPTRHQHLHVHGVPAGPPSLNRSSGTKPNSFELGWRAQVLSTAKGRGREVGELQPGSELAAPASRMRPRSRAAARCSWSAWPAR